MVVVSAHALLVLRENGAIHCQKRLDYPPLCATLYPAAAHEPGGGHDHLIVASHTGVTLIYREMELLWSARLSWPPAAMRVRPFGGQQGLLLSLAFDGTVTISYLGTDPPTSAVAVETKELNYEAMDEEHRRLLQIIRDSSSDTKVEPADGLTLRAQVRATRLVTSTLPRRCTSPVSIHDIPLHQVPSVCETADGDESSVVSTLAVRVFVSYTGNVTLENVTLVRGRDSRSDRVVIRSCVRWSLSLEQRVVGLISRHAAPRARQVASCTPPLFLTADTVVLPSLASGNRTPTIVPFTFRARTHELPVSLGATVIATYTTPSGEPRCAGCAWPCLPRLDLHTVGVCIIAVAPSVAPFHSYLILHHTRLRTLPASRSYPSSHPPPDSPCI